jgi:hypothetical protein
MLSRLALPCFCMNCIAMKTCTTSKESALLGAYLLATFSSALMYMCMANKNVERAFIDCRKVG